MRNDLITLVKTIVIAGIAGTLEIFITDRTLEDKLTNARVMTPVQRVQHVLNV